jgi:hypothetical protein
MCLLQCLNGHIRVIYPTSHQSMSSWPPALPRSAPDAHWPPLEARYLRYIRLTSTAVMYPLTCEKKGVGGCVMCWCYCGREYGRCGCCRVHHRPLPRPLSTPTNSHNRSSPFVLACPVLCFDVLLAYSPGAILSPLSPGCKGFLSVQLPLPLPLLVLGY